MEGLTLTLADYIITAIMLLIPLGIGVFYAWKDSNRATREQYLLGGREMAMLPVALSIFVTFQSAISLIGFPSDVYQNSPMIVVFYVGIALSFLVGYFTLVPLMYPLRLTSIYEYLEMRFNSPAVRMLSTVIGMVQTFGYMIVALLAPGLAVQAVVGTPFWVSVLIVGGIGTVYTAIGGIKSVVWTDAFQTIVVFVGVFILIAKGVMAVGSLEKVWTIAEDGGRTNFHHLSFDPRVRHTWWSLTIGVCFVWLTNIYNQSTLQRVSSMKSIQGAQRAYLANIPINIFYGAIMTIIGIIMYSYFYVIRCDPFVAGLVSNRNQMVPFFMVHALQDLPGMVGLYMATLFSGALSTLSSGINALAANTVEDILGGCLRSVSEARITVFTKIMVCIYGFSIIGITYLCRSLKGPVTQMASSVFGACGSAVLGMFIMGSMVPWSNKYGALAGGIVTISINIWIAIGGMLYGKATKPLPSVPSDQCTHLFGSDPTLGDVITLTNDVNVTATSLLMTSPLPTDSLNANAPDPYAYTHFIYDLTYEWYSLTGTIICSVVCLIVSRLTKSLVPGKVEPKLILPMLHRFWFDHDDGTTAEIQELSQRMMAPEKNTHEAKNNNEL